MTQKSELGKLGEDLACQYLINKGYKIIERNFRKPWGELDVVARAPDKTLVFIEVKTVRQSFGAAQDKSGNPAELNPEEQMTSLKMRKLKRVAALYAGRYQELIKDKRGWRIDLLALTMTGENCLINHYENIA